MLPEMGRSARAVCPSIDDPAGAGWRGSVKAALVGIALSLSGCSTTAHHAHSALHADALYVAMGSSYAAGAGIGSQVGGSGRCGRTENNYAHLVAAKLQLKLVDVSCGGATTAHILGPWLELPAQLDAITPDTKLVTLTIGGNDVGYTRNLRIAACGRTPKMAPPAGRECPPAVWPSASAYQLLEQQLRQIAREVRRRAPEARLVFIDYLRVLPESGSCSTVPLDGRPMAAAREAFRRMAAATKAAAIAEGAALLRAGELSKGHDSCSPDPWALGHPGKPADWHPTAAGHAAIAAALISLLR